MNRGNRIVIVIDRRAAALGAGTLAVLALSALVRSESMSLTMTYPVPAGIYNQIITTGNSGTVPADSTLARNAGNVVLVPGTNANGRVGIGTASPEAKLDVAGGVRVGDAVQCANFTSGTIRYHAGAMQYCDGANWVPMGSKLFVQTAATKCAGQAIVACTADNGTAGPKGACGYPKWAGGVYQLQSGVFANNNPSNGVWSGWFAGQYVLCQAP